MKFVFCEGKDDVAVVCGLASHLQLNLQVEEYGGKNKLPMFLESLQKRPEFAQQKVGSVAILRDANGDANASFASVRDALQRGGFSPPKVDATFSKSAPRVGIFIVGVNGQGMIEDVCLNSVSDQPEFSCVDDYFNCISQKSPRAKFSSKAKVRVWMASHVDYEYHVGKAADEGYWPWESPAFGTLRNFLKAL
ncbi:MAG: DUF3226 domain-containing protein [Verrucomicrobiota bacterium]